MAKRYLDPKADLTFKKVFGEHPDLVTSGFDIATISIATGMSEDEVKRFFKS